MVVQRLHGNFLTDIFSVVEIPDPRPAGETRSSKEGSEEEAALPPLLRRKAPGLSQSKLAFLAGAPRALADLLQLCLSHGHCSPDAVPRKASLNWLSPGALLRSRRGSAASSSADSGSSIVGSALRQAANSRASGVRKAA